MWIDSQQATFRTKKSKKKVVCRIPSPLGAHFAAPLGCLLSAKNRGFK